MTIYYNAFYGMKFADGEVESFVDSLDFDSNTTINTSNYLVVQYARYKSLLLNKKIYLFENGRDIGINPETGCLINHSEVDYNCDIVAKILKLALERRKTKNEFSQ